MGKFLILLFFAKPVIFKQIKKIILQSVHLLYKYAIRINFCFIRTRRINFQAYSEENFKPKQHFYYSKLTWFNQENCWTNKLSTCLPLRTDDHIIKIYCLSLSASHTHYWMITTRMCYHIYDNVQLAVWKTTLELKWMVLQKNKDSKNKIRWKYFITTKSSK
jgi:hypothetical protein